MVQVSGGTGKSLAATRRERVGPAGSCPALERGSASRRAATPGRLAGGRAAVRSSGPSTFDRGLSPGWWPRQRRGEFATLAERVGQAGGGGWPSRFDEQRVALSGLTTPPAARLPPGHCLRGVANSLPAPSPEKVPFDRRVTQARSASEGNGSARDNPSVVGWRDARPSRRQISTACGVPATRLRRQHFAIACVTRAAPSRYHGSSSRRRTPCQ
jgi:hypothetical protein